MKVITRKTLKIIVFCLALMPTQSVFAANWLSYCLPSWIAKPIAWISDRIMPYMPANTADTYAAREPIAKEVSSTRALLHAEERTQQIQIFPKFNALDEDLGWMDRTVHTVQEEHAIFLDQQEADIIQLQDSQKAVSIDLKDLTGRALALKTQLAQADLSITAIKEKLNIRHEEIGKNIAVLKVAFEKSYVEITDMVQKGLHARGESDTRIETDMTDMHKKVTVGIKKVDEFEQVTAGNNQKFEAVVKELETISAQLDQCAQHKAKKKQKRLDRKHLKIASGMLPSSLTTKLIDK